jgi:hypothetical protein
MGLYQRWIGVGAEKMDVHAFGSALSELARGAVTKTQIVSSFSLDTAEEAELDSIVAAYQASGNATDKVRFIGKLEDVMILSESGFYLESKAKTELGF